MSSIRWAPTRRSAAGSQGRTKRWTAIAAVVMALVSSAVVFTPQPAQAASPMPALVDFGEVLVGESASRTITFSNTGNVPVGLEEITVGSPFTRTGGTCAVGEIAVGADCTIIAAFTPTALGSTSTVLAVRTTQAGTHAVDLTGSGVVPPHGVTITPGSAVFPATAVGVEAELEILLTVTTWYSYATPAQVNGITGDFTATEDVDCIFLLHPSDSCTISVRFTPTAAGERTGTLTVFTIFETFTIPLSGTGIGPYLVPSATSVDFGDVVMGQAPPTIPVTITNEGNSAAPVTAAATGVFQVDASACAAALAPQASCTALLSFAPTSAGDASGTATFTGGTSTTTVALTGKAVARTHGFGVSLESLSFADTAVGASSPPVPFVVTNMGNVPTVFGVTASGGDFSVESTTCTGAIAAGATCEASIVFSPKSAGPQSGSLHTSSPEMVLTVPMSGTGGIPNLVADQSSLDFGEVEAGSASTVRVVTIENTGSVAAPVAASATGSFTADAAACGPSLAPGASCEVSVTFEPTVGGQLTGTLTAVAGISMATVALQGVGQPLRVDVSSLDVGTVHVGGVVSAPAPVTVTNLSGAAVPLLFGGLTAPFGGTTDCPETLPANASCEARVTFTPTTAGAATADLVVLSMQASDLTVALRASALAPVFRLGASPTSSSFAATEVGEASPLVPFVVTNTGNMPVVLGVVRAGGDFSVGSTTCTGTLAVGAICEVSVGFSPTSAGSRTGSLSLTSRASTLTVPLSGTGLAPHLVADPASVDFGDVEVGAASMVTVVTVENTGSAAAPVVVSATGPFTADAAACTSLAPGASCEVRVTFQPTIGGAASGTLTAVGGISTTTVALEGNALPLRIDISSLDLGSVAIGATGSKAATITNLTGTPVPVAVGLAAASARAVAAAASPFAVDTDCPATLAGYASCTVTVTFTPTVLGSVSARLAVSALGGAQESIVDLTGVGLAAVGPPAQGPAPGTAPGSAPVVPALPATGADPATFGVAAGGAFAVTAGIALFWTLRRRTPRSH